MTRLCLIGIVTCPNDGWRSLQKNSGGGGSGSSTTILESLVGGTYRIPSLTARTRLNAFLTALEKHHIKLEDPAAARLPILAASAAWAKGSAFGKIAKNLKAITYYHNNDKSSGGKDDIRKLATLKDLEKAMHIVKKDFADFAQVTFQAREEESRTPGKSFFESVGGNVEAKIALEDALAFDPKKQQMLKRFGLSPPTGIMLYGPPGTGKTLLAKAVARLLKAPPGSHDDGNNNALALGGTFISLSSSDIVRAEIGTSEKMVVSAFEFADKNAPSVIFLDEFQALFTERSRGGSGKLATTLLQCLDDIKRWQEVDKSAAYATKDNTSDIIGSHRVIVLAATNTPWMVDSAFLRPGRFDRVVHVGLPTIEERESILFVHIQHMKIAGDSGARKVLCQSLAKRTGGFSGADLAALCRAAAIRTLMESSTMENPEESEIKETHFIKALELDVKASSDDKLVQRLLAWKP